MNKRQRKKKFSRILAIMRRAVRSIPSHAPVLIVPSWFLEENPQYKGNPNIMEAKPFIGIDPEFESVRKSLACKHGEYYPLYCPYCMEIARAGKEYEKSCFPDFLQGVENNYDVVENVIKAGDRKW